MDFPILETERLLLREWSNDDANDLFAFYSDAEVLRFTPVNPHKSIDDSLATIGRFRDRFSVKKEGIVWAVEWKESGTVIGECGLHGLEVSHARAQVGYSFSKSVWGKGIATEAVRRILPYAFSDFPFFHLNRLEALTDPRNINSGKVLEKSGFVREGILRQYEFEKGEFIDIVLYAMLRSDLTPQK